MALNPVQAPQIPDLATDLFGNTDLFSNKPVQLTDKNLFELPKLPDVNVSNAAKQAMEQLSQLDQQAAQARQQSSQQAKQAQDYVANLNQQTTQLQKQYQQEIQRREQEAKQKEAERKAAEKEIKKELSIDGSYLIKNSLQEFLNSPAYKNAGDVQRADMLAQRLPVIAESLKKAGYSPEIVDTSVKAYRQGVERDIRNYVDTTDKDWRDLGDVWNSAKAAVKSLSSTNATTDAGHIASSQESLLSGKETSGWSVEEMLSRDPSLRNYVTKVSDNGFDSFSTFKLRSDLTPAQVNEFKAKSAAALASANTDASTLQKEADDLKSSQSLSQQRLLKNMNYQQAVMAENRKKTNSDTWYNELVDGLSIVKDYPLTFAVDQSGNLAISLGASAAAGIATGAALGSGGATSPVAVGAGTIAAGAINRLVAGAVGAGMTRSDLINTTRQEILNTSFDKLATMPEWKKALELSGGNPELARQRIAAVHADDNASAAMLMSFALNMFGPEALAGKVASNATRAVAGQTVTRSAGNAFLKTGLELAGSTISEGAEEGGTQLASNYALNTMGLKSDVWDNVWTNAGMGAAGGLVTGGLLSGVSTAQTYQENTRQAAQQTAISAFNNAQAKTGEYAQLGSVNFADLRSTVGNDMLAFSTSLERGFANSPTTINNMKQAYYDTIVDKPDVWNHLTVPQQKEMKSWLSATYGVNTNDTVLVQDNTSMQQLRDKNQLPTDVTLHDTWRALHNQNTTDISDVRVANALAEITKTLGDPNGTERASQRNARYTQIRDDVAERNQLTAQEKQAIDIFASQHLATDLVRETTNGNQNNQASNQTSQPPVAGGQPNQGANTQNAPVGAPASPPAAQAAQPAPSNPPAPTTGAGPSAANTQGAGNNGTQQTAAQTNPASPAPAASPSPQPNPTGTAQAGNTGSGADTTTTVGTASPAPTGDGDTRPTSQADQPTGLAGPTAESPTVSGGSNTTTSPERGANGQRAAITTQAGGVSVLNIAAILNGMAADGAPNIGVLSGNLEKLFKASNRNGGVNTREGLTALLIDTADIINKFITDNNLSYDLITIDEVNKAVDELMPRSAPNTKIASNDNSPLAQEVIADLQENIDAILADGADAQIVASLVSDLNAVLNATDLSSPTEEQLYTLLTNIAQTINSYINQGIID
jgi:hypothetical protein